MRSQNFTKLTNSFMYSYLLFNMVNLLVNVKYTWEFLSIKITLRSFLYIKYVVFCQTVPVDCERPILYLSLFSSNLTWTLSFQLSMVLLVVCLTWVRLNYVIEWCAFVDTLCILLTVFSVKSSEYFVVVSFSNYKIFFACGWLYVRYCTYERSNF